MSEDLGYDLAAASGRKIRILTTGCLTGNGPYGGHELGCPNASGKGSCSHQHATHEEDKTLENLVMLEDGDDARYLGTPTGKVMDFEITGIDTHDGDHLVMLGDIEIIDPRRAVASRRELDDGSTIWVEDIPNASKSAGGTNKDDLIMLE